MKKTIHCTHSELSDIHESLKRLAALDSDELPNEAAGLLISKNFGAVRQEQQHRDSRARAIVNEHVETNEKGDRVQQDNEDGFSLNGFKPKSDNDFHRALERLNQLDEAEVEIEVYEIPYEMLKDTNTRPVDLMVLEDMISGLDERLEELLTSEELIHENSTEPEE